jgi:hypothetical protein
VGTPTPLTRGRSGSAWSSAASGRSATSTGGTDGRPHLAYEAEALGQRAVAAILRQRLDELLPEPLERVLEREVTERAAVVRLLSRRPRNAEAA